MLLRRIVLFILAAAVLIAGATTVSGQTVASSGVRSTDSLAAQSRAPSGAAVAPPSRVLPVFLTVGLAYGRRHDGCETCISPDNTDGFSGYLSVGKPLGHGLGVGAQVSVWRHSAPSSLAPTDSTGAAVATSLTNTLGNASLIFSWQVWHLWVQGGGGAAWVGDDYVPNGSGTAVHASGLGLGYTFGGGASLPLAGPVSLAFFANVNFGHYDLSTPSAVLRRGAKHRYVEFGIGLTTR